MCTNLNILPLAEEALKRSKTVNRNQLNAVAFSYGNAPSGKNLYSNSTEPSEVVSSESKHLAESIYLIL